MLPWEINLMPCFSVKINGSQFGKFVIFRGIIHNQAYSEAKKSRRNQLRSMTSDCILYEITKYGIYSFTQITLAVDKELTYRQDSAPDWLKKSCRQLVICIYRQRTNKLTKG